MLDVLKVVVLALGAFVTLFLIAKFLGKKQVGELDFIDYVVGISIGSISAEMATNTADKPFYHYIISMLVFFVMTLIVDFLATKASFLKKFFKGTPLVIIKNGTIDFDELKKSKLDINDLTALARSKGFFDFSLIAYAIFETDGSLSILPKDEQKILTKSDIKFKINHVFLPQNIIVDGDISKFSLKSLNKTEEWVKKRLNISNKEDLKNILLAVYNEEKDSFTIWIKK